MSQVQARSKTAVRAKARRQDVDLLRVSAVRVLNRGIEPFRIDRQANMYADLATGEPAGMLNIYESNRLLLSVVLCRGPDKGRGPGTELFPSPRTKWPRCRIALTMTKSRNIGLDVGDSYPARFCGKVR
jgi:hypothetical protein